MNFLFFKKQYEKMKIPPPQLHVVLGSGFGKGLEVFEQTLIHSKESSFASWEKTGEIFFSEVNHLKNTSVLGHKGIYHYFFHKESNQSLCIQAGRLHGYEGYTPKEVVQPLIGPFLSGTKNFILTNAAGTLSPSISVGSLMIIKDHVNLTGKNPLYGTYLTNEKGKAFGPRFVDLKKAYDPELSLKIKLELKKQEVKTFEGLYLGLMGPSFETPAEIKLFQSWGLQAVGMSTVWEVIALRQMGARLGALSLITNLGCGLKEESESKDKKTEEIQDLNHLNFLSRFQSVSQKVIQACFRLISQNKV